jgi:fermentation-respiration switch protein FrsA (DUF1100 family)
MLDSEAVLDYVFNSNKTELTPYVSLDNVYIYGRSLGGAVAIYITDKLKPKIKGLILENTFSSMGEMVDKLFPLLKNFKKYILKNNWPSNTRIGNIQTPMLFLMSELDELVPMEHMECLYELAKKAAFKQKFVIIGGTHNESWQKGGKEYVKQITQFLDKCSLLSSCDIHEKSINKVSINDDEETYLIDNKKKD